MTFWPRTRRVRQAQNVTDYPAPVCDEGGDDPAELGAGVLLEEVAGVGDGGVVEAAGAGDVLLEDRVHASGDRVGVAERGEERPVPLAQRGPGEPVGRGGRVVGPGRHQGGHRPGADLALLGRERRVVRRPDLVGHPAHAAGGDQPADVEHLGLLDRVAEHPPDLRHVEVAGREAGVGRDHAREPVGVLGHQPQPEQPAPVLADQGHVAQVEVVEDAARASTRRAGRRCGPPAPAACPTARTRPGRAPRTGCRRR